MKYLIKLLILNLIFLSNALSQTIEIQASNVIVNEKLKFSHYFGDVIFTQKNFQRNLKLKAEEVIIKKKGKGHYQITALGEKLKLILSVAKKSKIQASAKKIIYSTKANLIQLIEDANLIQNNDTFSGDKISYDINKDKVSIEGSANKRTKLKIKL